MFLIWFDNDRKRPLHAKVQAAVERYEKRFGSAPVTAQIGRAHV